MSISFRRKLFIFFVFVFLAVGTGVVYYSQGFRIDLSSFKIQKTGAIYVETSPRDVQIFLNQKEYRNNSGILQKGTLLSDVLPKKYRLILKKDGFYDYEKNVEVFPSQVIRILNALLVPQKIEKENALEEIKGDLLVDRLPTRETITQDTTKNIFYLYPANTVASNLTSKIASFLKLKITRINFFPGETDKFIVQTSKGIYGVDLKQQKASPLIEGEIENFTFTDKNLYAVKIQKGKTTVTAREIVIYDLVLNKSITQEKLAAENKVADLKTSSDLLALLFENGALWLYKFSDRTFLQIAHSAKQASFSPDNAKIVFQDKDGKVFVYLLSDDIISLETFKNNSLRVKITDALKIEKIFFSDDSSHFIVVYPKQIYLAELTRHEPNNQFFIGDKKGSVLYSPKENKIYFIENSSLKAIGLNFSE
ncbi:hypothetical protein A2108_01805 [Candidatus Wolfebacteria bacterium GWA1_42_9]|uniref:PEGA domain-containing protein n=1 Tax=Candidatus Wolfebacteria bacterium GWA1_42_9 TaxID=1802553 RepID=A0A1F8DN72_9BACT|nr:MAG: hypothetical protein A2108_01805 [Candidatus Wolfebacteria bacterium GWA1_42_9]